MYDRTVAVVAVFVVVVVVVAAAVAVTIADTIAAATTAVVTRAVGALVVLVAPVVVVVGTVAAIGATRRKPANTPCTAARSAPLLLTLPPQGQRSFRFKASTRASAGRSPRFPTQDTLCWGRKRGLFAAISDWRSPRLAGCRSILHSADSAVLHVDQVSSQ